MPAEEPMGAPLLLEQIALADPVAGEAYAAERCLSCHVDAEGEPATATGPNLYGVVGAVIGRDPDFAYSFTMRQQNAAGTHWTLDRLDAFMADPQIAMIGTRMGFSGIADETDRLNVLAYLRLLSDDPVPVGPREAVVGIAIAGLSPVGYFGLQATNGQDTFNAQCASCHGIDLGGRDELEPLTGAAFATSWFDGPVGDLYDFIRRQKPTGNPRSLTDDQYVNIVAYLLRRNGFAAGDAWLEPSSRELSQLGFYQY